MNAFDDVLWDYCETQHAALYPSFHSLASFLTVSNKSHAIFSSCNIFFFLLLLRSKWMRMMMHSGNNFGPIIAHTFRMYSHWCQRTRYGHCAKIIQPIWRHCATKRPNDWSEPLTIVVAHIPNNKQVNTTAFLVPFIMDRAPSTIVNVFRE